MGVVGTTSTRKKWLPVIEKLAKANKDLFVRYINNEEMGFYGNYTMVKFLKDLNIEANVVRKNKYSYTYDVEIIKWDK